MVRSIVAVAPLPGAFSCTQSHDGQIWRVYLKSLQLAAALIRLWHHHPGDPTVSALGKIGASRKAASGIGAELPWGELTHACTPIRDVLGVIAREPEMGVSHVVSAATFAQTFESNSAQQGK